jgi:hypothetical protein
MAGTVDDTSAMTAWDASNAWTGYRVRLTDGKWHDVPRANQSENQQAWICCGVARKISSSRATAADASVKSSVGSGFADSIFRAEAMELEFSPG